MLIRVLKLNNDLPLMRCFSNLSCAPLPRYPPLLFFLGSSCQIKQEKLEKRDASPIQGVSRAGMKAMRKGIASGEAKGERTGRRWNRKCRATSKQYAKEKKMSLNTFPPGYDEYLLDFTAEITECAESIGKYIYPYRNILSSQNAIISSA